MIIDRDMKHLLTRFLTEEEQLERFDELTSAASAASTLHIINILKVFGVEFRMAPLSAGGDVE